jgi:excisionase family DNA binding protein
MTLAEVAKAFTVDDETVRRMAIAKEIPAFRMRGRWAVPRQYVEDVLNGHLAAWRRTAEGGLARDPCFDPFAGLNQEPETFRTKKATGYTGVGSLKTQAEGGVQ